MPFISRRRPLRIVAVVASVSLVLGATPSGALLSKSEERDIGRKVVGEVRQEFRILEDPYLKDYLDGIGDRLAKAEGGDHFEPDFHVVADSRINAFAVPGGHVFVTSQTLLSSGDESELAGVVAHELGHVEGRHMAHRIEDSTKLNLATLAAVLAAAFLTRSPQAGAAITTFAVAGAQTKMLQYSRTDEEDADRRALRTLAAAGYDGWGLVRFMETIRKQSPAPEGVPAYFFTHPLPENRATYLSQALDNTRPLAGDAKSLGPLWRAQARVLSEDPRPWGLALLEQRAADNPASADAQLGLAIGLEAAGRYADAEAALAKARSIAPGDPEVLHETASVAMRSGRHAEGLATLEALRSKGIATEAALRDLGWAYLEAQQGNKALEVYDELAKQPDDRRRWDKLAYYRGLALGKAGREGEAHATLGDYFQRFGDRELARWHYQQSLRLVAPGPLREQVAKKLQEMGKPAEPESKREPEKPREQERRR